jgi:hypothetical protein
MTHFRANVKIGLAYTEFKQNRVQLILSISRIKFNLH